MFFYPSDIFHFHSFGCSLVSQLGSLLQKCDPDRCAQNSHKNRFCFFTHQTFSSFIPLAVPWGPNLDHCYKSVILTGAREIHIKVVSVFLPIRHFPFSFLWLSLGVPTGILNTKVWSWHARAQNSHKSRLCFVTHPTFAIFIPLAVPWCPNLDPCGKSAILTGARKIHIQVVYVFCPSDISHFHSFGRPLGSQLRSWRQKCDPDRCSQNAHKSRFCFFTHQTFSIFLPLAVPWGPTLDPCSKSVILTSARKIHIKVVYVFLPIRHFPFSFLWLSFGVPTWILAAKVWSWQVHAKFT